MRLGYELVNRAPFIKEQFRHIPRKWGIDAGQLLLDADKQLLTEMPANLMPAQGQKQSDKDVKNDHDDQGNRAQQDNVRYLDFHLAVGRVDPLPQQVDRRSQ